MGYANLPQTEPVCNQPQRMSAAESFKNADTQHHHLPIAPSPSPTSQNPADFLAIQFGFCNSTQIPSKLQAAAIPATFNA